uniref:Uncharacterized protein LOC111109456 isoform X4 n=1 Tax=Crassostrea virginica TaxID=6565 RepID=A0A8B8BE56_CRAVI|nr:uncharacterized protein LOC111109456 isoform X4 [Crassostrea virginica]
MFELRPTPCAVTKSDWEEDKSNFTCKSPINVYHCLQDEKNRSGEICIQPVWVQPHPVCLNKTHRKELSVHGEYSVSWLWTLGPTLLVLTLLALATACFVWRRKRVSRSTEDETRVILLKGQDNDPFHKTAAFHEATQYLENGGKFLVLSGIWGSGKTKTAKEVFMKVTGISPTIITDLERFNWEEQNQGLIFDEAISGELSSSDVNRIREKMKSWFENGDEKSFIIFTSMDDQEKILKKINPVAPDEDFKLINLKDRLTRGDRTQILDSHFKVLGQNKDFSKIEDLATKGKNKSLGYPEICALYCRCDEFQKEKGVDFCEKPLHFLKSFLENMYRFQEKKFLMLVYMSLNQMEIDVKNINEKLRSILEMYKHKQTDSKSDTNIEVVEHGKAEDFCSLLSWEFVDKIPNTTKYKLQHNVIKKMTLIVFGTYYFDKLLEVSNETDIRGWIKKDGLFTIKKNFFGDIEPSLFIDADKWVLYEKKMKMVSGCK